MNNYVSGLIFKAFSKLRNPTLFRQFKFLKSSEKKNREFLQQLQENRFLEFFKYVLENSPYYIKKYEEFGIDINDIKSISDIKKLPTLSKSDLLQYNSSIHSVDTSLEVRKASTSGTTGEALVFQRNEEWDSMNRASVMRGYSWHGVNVWDKNGYFWGFNLDKKEKFKTKILDRLQNRDRIFSYTDENIEKFSKRMKDATYLSGYSSMIYHLAKVVNKKGIKFNHVKMIKGTSEMILPSYQEEVTKAFGSKMISEYGAAETGLIAFECENGRMHINMESCFVEVDDDDNILVTNFMSKSFPIIRYRLGDVVKISDDYCSCGREHFLVDEIIGRKGKDIVGKSCSYPSLTLYYVFKSIASDTGLELNYKAVQVKTGELKVKVEKIRTNNLEELVSSYLYKYFGEDLNCDVLFVDQFDIEQKKSHSFVSELD